MDNYTGRPNMYSDVLITMHNGPWFNYQGKHEQTYDQLVVDDGYIKPTKAELDTALAKMQAEHDSKQYQRDRKEGYPDIGDQLDMIYHAGLGGDEFQEAIKAIKDKYPKE